MSKPTEPGPVGYPEIRIDDDLWRLLTIVDTEIDEERQSPDTDFTAQEKLDVRMRDLDDAVRHLLDDGP